MCEQPDSGILDGQQRHWEHTFSRNHELFGEEPSYPAREVARLMQHSGAASLVELGAGQGRDALFFAHSGFSVHALDYSTEALGAMQKKSRHPGMKGTLVAVPHDVRSPLPFPDASQDACYAHMLLCMALTTAELAALLGEIRRVLKPGGLVAYTVRHTGDAHWGQGIHRGEAMYEYNGFIVHFFDREKVSALSAGFTQPEITEFEEGGLPRRLFLVTMNKL